MRFLSLALLLAASCAQDPVQKLYADPVTPYDETFAAIKAEQDRWWLERMLYVVGRLLLRRQVLWWASHGTLLGAARHGGPVPGDTDVDIDIFLHDAELLGTQGFIDDLNRNGIDLLSHGRTSTAYSLRPMGGGKDGPHLDICIATLRGDNVSMRYVSYYWFHRRFHWNPGPKQHWRFLRFGSYHVIAPKNFGGYLTAMYGSDWNRTMKRDCRLTQHSSEEGCIGVSTPIKPEDRRTRPLLHSPTGKISMCLDTQFFQTDYKPKERCWLM